MKKKKTNRKVNRDQEKQMNRIFIGFLIGAAVLIAALVVLRLTTPKETGYIITSDGHIHAADGTHIGEIDNGEQDHAENETH